MPTATICRNDGSQMSKLKAVIGFQLIQCIRCSGTRIRGLPCPDCGAKADPREVDLSVQQRKRLLDGIQAEIEPERTSDSPIVLDSVYGLAEECDQLVRRLKAAASSLEGSHPSIQPMKDALHYFVRLRMGIHAIQPHRQQMGLSATAQRVLGHLERFVQLFLDMLVAATPKEAEEIQAEGLRCLNGAHLEFTDFTRRVELRNSLDFTSTSKMLRSMMRLLVDADAASQPVELLTRANQRVADILGVKGEVVVGLPFAIAELMAEIDGNKDFLVSCFAQAHRVFSGGLTALARVAAEDGFLADLHDGQVSVFNSYWSFQAACDSAVTDRQLVEALLDINVRQVEGPAAVLARALMLTSGRKSTSYPKLARGNATEHIRQAREDDMLVGLLDGVDDHLRIARSHGGGVRYREDSIEATARQQTHEYSHDELIDIILRGTDSCLAGTLALLQALADAQIHLDDVEMMGDFGLTASSLASISMSLMARSEVTVDIVGDTIRLEADGPLAATLSALAAGACSCVKGPSRFEFRHTDEGETRLLTGPTIAFIMNPGSADTEFDTLVATMRTALGLRLNGQSVVSKPVLGTFCVALASQAMAKLLEGSTSATDVAVQIMALRRLAQAARYAELEGALRKCSRWVAMQDRLPDALDTLNIFVRDAPFNMP